MVALGFFVAEGEKLEGVAKGRGEAVEPGRIGFELAQAIGASERNGADEIEALLRNGDQAGTTVARVGAYDAEIEPAQFIDRLAQGGRMHVEALPEGREGHVGAFGQRVQHGQLQAGNAVALLEFEMEGGDGGIEPHPGDQGGKGLLLHFSF